MWIMMCTFRDRPSNLVQISSQAHRQHFVEAAEGICGTLCDPQTADFVAGAALCEPQAADFVVAAHHFVNLEVVQMLWHSQHTL